jgi:chromosome segregation ATPase
MDIDLHEKQEQASSFLLAAHQKQIENTQIAITEIRSVLNEIKTDLAIIPERLSGSNDRARESINSLGARIGALEERTKNVESDISVLKRDMSHLVLGKEFVERIIAGVLISVVAAAGITLFIHNNPNFTRQQTSNTK